MAGKIAAACGVAVFVLILLWNGAYLSLETLLIVGAGLGAYIWLIARQSPTCPSCMKAIHPDAAICPYCRSMILRPGKK
jgi:hypothetical protein